MKLLKSTFFFLIINFGSLAIGSWLMNNGPLEKWYQNLNQAPWTPPGSVFGIAWTIIMICFSVYLAKLFEPKYSLKLVLIFAFQCVLNISWNYIFFNRHLILLGFITILILTVLLNYYYFKISKNMGAYKYLLLPYVIWLYIATSLNLYILIYN